ncbi:MAG: XrtN system VIT domain-containing protein [Chitinophagaceae bacterium]|nr:XrtN system VIT domain-containing protein [Chitinophagaceae bacterium]
MQTDIQKQTDGLYIGGLVLLAISFVLFCVPFFHQPVGNGFFVVHFSITGLYFFILLFSGRLRKGREGLQPVFVFLLLFLVSAYALNREISIFEPSADWFTVLLLIVGVNYLLLYLFDLLPGWFQYLCCFIGGVALVTFIYLSLYLFPTYLIGVIASLFLGISLHVFVPLLLCIYTLVFFRKIKALSKQYLVWFRAGIVVSVLCVALFVTAWGIRVHRINKAMAVGSGDLPAWVSAAQKMKPGFIENRICKAGLVYDVPDNADDLLGDIFWRMPSRSFDEQVKHDPLVLIASLIAGKTDLSASDRINILKSLYDSRHQAEERLWTGENLVTRFINNNVEVWPQFRIAYSELKIKVENNNEANNWRNNVQEAIYTFHMPEGSVVTSLSLWINGVEEKGILTTRSKADNAYKTIVGREVRDPSVVHWQEGNRVIVRVFPVDKGKYREFKIGITSPLRLLNNRLLYQPVYFDGPSAATAKEETKIRFMQKPVNMQTSAAFDPESETVFTRKGRFNAGWYIAIDKAPVNTAVFSFNGNHYRAFTNGHEKEPVDIKNVYLDINASWLPKECSKVYSAVKRKNIFVVDEKGELQALTEQNADRLFDALRSNSFSLFPFSKIHDPASALVITKSDISSPLLEDIKNTEFGQLTKAYISGRQKVHLFNIGTSLSPYLQSLKEVQSFNYAQGDVVLLEELLHTHRYPVGYGRDNEVVLDTADMIIRQVEGKQESVAPDHLMRLFVYNSILKKHGAAILSGADVEQDAIAEAEQAYVVSPVSSLVVLESQRDYDRFDIKASKDSLKNASLASKGAVPEPHEWAMIIIAVLLLLYVRYRSFDPSTDNV